MAEKIKVVMAGCGSIIHTWIKALQELDCVDIVGFVDLNAEAADAKKELWGNANAIVGSDLSEIIDEARPEVVFDCTIPLAHADVAVTALRKGCHVLGEKPLADSMENARRIVDTAKECGRIHAVIQNRRYQPEIVAFRNFIASKKLGDLTTLNCDFYIGAHIGGFRDRMEHVLLLDMAIHTFDAARYISGANPVSVYCREWNPKGSWYDHDASAIAIFEMDDGSVYTYRGSWCSEGLNTSWESAWHAVCERGSAFWDGGKEFRAQLAVESEDSQRKLEDVEINGDVELAHTVHAGVIAEFLDCVRTGKVPMTTSADNINSLAMVFGAIESAREGKLVRIGC